MDETISNAGWNPSENECAVALAAWVSIQLLRPVPREEDEIASVMAWKEDIGDVADFGEILLPSDPTNHAHSAAASTAERILPRGSAEMLWKYHFFEGTVDAAATDARQLIEAVAKAVRTRLLPGATAYPHRFGQHIVGPLGIVTRTKAHQKLLPGGWSWAPPVAGSYCEYVACLRDHSQLSVYGPYSKALNLKGWSSPWLQWHEKYGPAVYYEGVRPQWRVTYRDDAGPPWPIEEQPPLLYPDLMGSELQRVFDRVSSLDANSLCRVLELCLQHDRSAFFSGVDWKDAPAGHAFLLNRSDGISAESLREVLAVPPAETVVAAAMELGLASFSVSSSRNSWFSLMSFSEILSAVLLEAFDKAACRSALEPFMRLAGGPDWDRVLHYVVKYDPLRVLETHIEGNPVVATHLARMTGAPLRFHRDPTSDRNAWDPADSKATALLSRHVRGVLGEEQPPRPPERALPFTSVAKTAIDGNDASDKLSGGRRRVEYLLKTAIQYLFALRYNWIYGDEANWWVRLSPLEVPHFWEDDEFTEAVSTQLKNSDGSHIKVPKDAKAVFSTLHGLLHAAGSLIPSAAPAYLVAVRDAQRLMLKAFAQPQLNSFMNLGAHDNRITRTEQVEAIEALAAIDETVRSIDEALPTFAVFVEAIQRPNRPRLVRTEPYEPLGMNHRNAKWDHYITNERKNTAITFRRDTVYSFTDVTRNQVSVNPVVLDWASWMQWSMINES
jgi:hypothetical protein